MRHEIDDDWRQQRAFTLRMVENFCALFFCHQHTTLKKGSRLFMHHSAKIGIGVHRIAKFDFFGFGENLFNEGIGDALHDQNTFYGGAALARVFCRALNGELRCFVEILIGKVIAYDQRIIAPKLEGGALVASFRRDQFANFDAAGEGDERDIRIGDHLVADIVGKAGDHLYHFGRQTRLIEDICQRDGGKRRQFGRLAYDAIIGGNGGGQLVRHHIERMVERGDGGDRPNRFALRVNFT